MCRESLVWSIDRDGEDDDLGDNSLICECGIIKIHTALLYYMEVFFSSGNLDDAALANLWLFCFPLNFGPIQSLLELLILWIKVSFGVIHILVMSCVLLFHLFNYLVNLFACWMPGKKVNNFDKVYYWISFTFFIKRTDVELASWIMSTSFSMHVAQIFMFEFWKSLT